MIRARSAIAPSGGASGAAAEGGGRVAGCGASRGGRAAGGGSSAIGAGFARRVRCARPAAYPIASATTRAASTARVDTVADRKGKGRTRRGSGGVAPGARMGAQARDALSRKAVGAAVRWPRLLESNEELPPNPMSDPNDRPLAPAGGEPDAPAVAPTPPEGGPREHRAGIAWRLAEAVGLARVADRRRRARRRRRACRLAR